MIKAQSLEAILSIISFIHNVYMSLLEQKHQKGASVQERYKIYKKAAIYKNETQLEFEFDLRCHDSW